MDRNSIEDPELEDDIFLSNPDQPTAKKPERNSSQNQINQINTLLNKLGQQGTNEQVKKYRLKTILRSLESLISGNEACMNLQNDMCKKMKVTERIAGNANNILQPRFHSSEKKKGRPRKTPLKKPTEEDMKKLSE